MATIGSLAGLLDAIPAQAGGRAPITLSSRRGRRSALVGFQSIPPSSADAVVVPPGYTARVLIAWGDPISDGPAFRPDASNTSAEQAQQWGMHNDGVVYFKLRGSAEGLLVQNSEYTDDVLLFPDGLANWTPRRPRSRSTPTASRHPDQQASPVASGASFARLPTPGASPAQTPIAIGGPLAEDSRMKTNADPDRARRARHDQQLRDGHTPWGTYLACEENFNGYFRPLRPRSRPRAALRHHRDHAGSLWYTTDTRFNPAWSRTRRTGSAGSSRSTHSIRGRRRSSARRSGG